MVKQIIKEAIEKNPIGLKEAVEAELMERLQLALEAKKKSYKEDNDDDDDDDDDDDELEEEFELNESKIGQMAASMLSKGNANDLNDAIRKVFTNLRNKHGITYPPEKQREMTKKAIEWVHNKNKRR